MELTEEHIEAIKEVVRSVDYGSVTINISATSDLLELNVQRRIKLKKLKELVSEKQRKRVKVTKKKQMT